MVAIRSLVFNIAFYLNLIVIMVFGLPLSLSRRTVWIPAFGWCRSAVWLLETICRIKVEFRGIENIPTGGLIVAAKHQSFLETFGMAPFFHRPAYIMKDELKYMPVFGWYLHQTGMIPVKRGKRAKAMKQMNAAASRHLNDGKQILIFPEGTRKTPGDVPAYKIGVSAIYGQNNVPCLPVALNTGLFWPRRRFMRYPGTIIIEFLKPIPPGLERDPFMAQLETAIETACDRLLLETVEAHPDLPLDATTQQRIAVLKHKI